LAFNGGNVVVVPDNSAAWNLGNSFSLEMWIKPTSTGNQALLYSGLGCSECEAWSFLIGQPQSGCSGGGTTGRIVFAGGIAAVQSNASPGIGVWSHVAVTYNGAVMKMYVNGVLQSNTVAVTGSVGNSTHRNIGGDAGCGGRFFYSGAMDELRIWNRAICQSEVVNNMNCQLTTTANGLTANYHFNQGIINGNNTSVTTLTDASGNGATGTLNGFALTGSVSNWTGPGSVSNTSTCTALLVPDINIVGNSVYIPTGSTLTANTNNTGFGNVSIGTSLSQTFVIQNTGAAALTISSYSLSGSGATSFTITTNPAASVASSGSTAIVITFSPGATGLKQASLTIVSNDCDESPYVFNIDGTGAVAGAALNFDGSNDYVMSGNLSSAITASTTGITIEAWFKANAAGVIVDEQGSATPNSSGWNDSQIEVLSTGSVMVRVWPLLSVCIGTVSFGTWNHAVVRYDGSTSRLDGFLNGQISPTVGIGTWSNSVSNGHQQYYAFGLTDASNMGSGAYFNGSIDEVRIWNVPRTQCEIQSYMSCEIPSTATGLVANYHFNQGVAGLSNPTATTLTDASASNATGTLNNFALAGTTSNWVTPGGVTSGFTTASPPTASLLVTGNSATITNGSTATSTNNFTDFGAASSRTFLVKNAAASGTLTINGVTFSGANASEFSLTAVPALTTHLLAGASGSVTIGFVPTTPGTHSAIVTVSSNDCSAPNYSFVISASVAPAAALNFDGNNDYISIPSTPALNFGTSTDFTNEAWIKLSGSASSYAGIIVKGDQGGTGIWHQFVLLNNTIAAEFQNGSNAYTVGGTTLLNDGNWHHVAMVVSRAQNNARLYVDGLLDGSITHTVIGLNLDNNDPMLIGSERNNTIFFPGTIDEVRVWNTARTQCQIQTYMNCEIAAGTTSLVANYHFNQGLPGSNNPAVNTLTDASGNSNTGTLNNFALSGSTSNWVSPGSVVSGYSTFIPPDVEIDIQGNSTSITDGSATPSLTNGTDFGAACIGAVLTKTYTIKNTGGATLAVNSGTITGTDASLFTLGTLPSTVAANSNVTFTVAFTGTVAGAKNATININSNDCDESNYDFVITASISPGPSITVNSGTICSGGSFSIIPSGASTYTYSGGSANVSPTITSSYSVTGSSSAGCVSSNTAVATITVNALPVVSISASSPSVCYGGSVTLTGSGANTYTLTAPSGTVASIFSPTATAAYSVTGTSTAGCTSTNVAAVTVTVNALPTVAANTSTTQVCRNASVTLTGSGANTYAWTGGVTDGTPFAPASTTSYTVTGTSTAGCTSTNVAAVTVTVNALPTVVANTSSTAICINSSVTLTGNGASTYTWTAPAGTVTDGIAFTPTTTASYTVTGTSTAGCTSTNVAAVTVTVNALPVAGASAVNSVICLGGTTTVNGSGASTYTWSASAGTATDGIAFTPTTTASYSVTGTSTAGCTSTNVAALTITVNSLPTLTIASSNTAICINGTVALTASGASTYTWAAPAGTVSNGIAFSPTSTATYSVIGTNSNTCQNTATVAVIVNTLPTVSAAASSSAICINNTVMINGSGANTYTWVAPAGTVTDGIAFSPTTTASYSVTGTSTAGCTSTNVAAVTVTVNVLPVVSASTNSTVICFNNSITLTGSGANTYTWSAASGTVPNATAFSPTSTASYSVSGTSTAGCTSTNVAAVTVTVNSLPTLTISGSALICNGGASSLVVSGASTYTWSSGPTTNTIVLSPSATTAYTVTGTDANSCQNFLVKTVTVSSLPTVTASVSNSVICLNNTITLNGSGASTYTWSSPTATLANASAFSPTSTASYSVTGTSTAGCTSTNVAAVTVTVNALPTLAIASSNTAICINGTVALTASGANTYTWTGGAWTGSVTNGIAFSPTVTSNYSVAATNSNSCQNTATVAVLVNALPTVTAAASSSNICINATVLLNGSGANTYTWSSPTATFANASAFSPTSTASYSVTGTSTAGCTSTNVAAVTITVNTLPVVTASASSTAICLNNTITLNGGGASTYTWSSPTATLANASAFSPTSTASYSVTGTSTAGCTSTNVAVVTVTVNALPTLAIASSNTAICINGTVALTASGANTYTWTGGAWSGSVTNGIAFSPTTTSNYSVAATNSNSCQNTATVAVLVNALPTVTAATSSSAICINNTVMVTGSGATTYTWNASSSASVTNGSAFSPTVTATYSVSGTSTAGCTSTNVAAVTITVNALPVVTASASSTAICLNSSVTLNASGASTYTWSSPTGTLANASAFSPTATAAYSLTGTDLSGCTSTNVAAITVTVNPLPVLTANASSTAVCLGNLLTLNGSGASSYTWTSPTGTIANAAAFSPTITTTYTLAGTDLNTCQGSATITIPVNPNPTLSASASSTVTCLNNSVMLTGSGASSYTWSSPAGTISDGVAFSPTTTAAYSVTGTSSAGCLGTNTAVISIVVNPLPVVTASAANTAICSGGTTTLNGSGATSYTWSSGISNGAAFSPSNTATYTLTGTDANNCSNTAVLTITVNALPVLAIASSKTISCEAESTTLTVSGASTYTWSSASTTGATLIITPSITSTYSVSGTDVNGCVNSAAITQSVAPCNVTLSAVAQVTNISCGAKHDGRITISPTIAYQEYAINYIWAAPAICPDNDCSTLDSLAEGSYSVTVRLTYTINGNFVKTDSVAINGIKVLNLNGPCNLEVFTGITPNGDGANDVLHIRNITEYPHNKVVVFNRWGNQVFETSGYNNTDNAWPLTDINKLAAATYYYTIDLGDGSKTVKGWVEVMK
jgi:gliding motility-associated-like protein